MQRPNDFEVRRAEVAESVSVAVLLHHSPTRDVRPPLRSCRGARARIFQVRPAGREGRLGARSSRRCPPRSAFRADRDLPSGVRGPVGGFRVPELAVLHRADRLLHRRRAFREAIWRASHAVRTGHRPRMSRPRAHWVSSGVAGVSGLLSGVPALSSLSRRGSHNLRCLLEPPTARRARDSDIRGDTHVSRALDEIPKPVVVALLRAGLSRHADDHQPFGDAAQLFEDIASVRPRETVRAVTTTRAGRCRMSVEQTARLSPKWSSRVAI
jgi:hypothetical protein